jgi:hypothetical protein
MAAEKTRIENLKEAADELAWAVKGIPGEMVQWWHDCHRWDRPIESLEVVPDGNHQSVIAIPDPDYVMWKRLGYVADAWLILLALAIVFLVAAGVGVV